MKNYHLFPIASFPWPDSGYHPEAAGGLYVDEEGLHLMLRARQDEPRCRVNDYGGALCTDDCLEFFLMPRPDTPLYLNFEVNALGVYHLGLGTGRHGRAVFSEPAQDVTVEPFRRDGCWGVEAVFSPAFFERWFGSWPLGAMRGNFYKCGDATAHPHWGMWTPYFLPQPDFHRPELFPPLPL